MASHLTKSNFIELVEEYTNTSLRRKEDVKRLIQVAVTYEKEAEFENLIFTSKYICGLIRVLKNSAGIPEVENTEHIRQDLSDNIKKAAGQLNEFISGDDEELKKYFNKTYFSLTSENFNNLQQLFSDLESVKKYLNYLKRLP